MILIDIAIICLLMLLAVLFFYIIYGPDGNFITIYSFIFSSIVLILLVFQLNKPNAMDVYRGRTTLEITYKDNVPIEKMRTILKRRNEKAKHNKTQINIARSASHSQTLRIIQQIPLPF